MKVANELNTLMYKVVNESPLKAAITGKVYKTWRPTDSDKEDVVINTIVADTELIQTAVCNVNIHLPSIETESGTMPDELRFEELSNIAKQTLDQGHTTRFTYYTENTSLIKEQQKEQWYLNFRIRFRYHNTIN